MQLQEVLQDLSLIPQPYSGRGMYGKQCLAVALDEGQTLWHLAIAIGQQLESPPEPKTDTLGYGLIAYWPDIPFNEDLKITETEGA